MLVLNEHNKVKKYQERNNDGEKNPKPKQLEDAPFPGTVQGQVGWHSEQPGLVRGIPAHGNSATIR